MLKPKEINTENKSKSEYIYLRHIWVTKDMKNNILMRHLRLIGLHRWEKRWRIWKGAGSKSRNKAAAALSSGTAAIHMALKAAGVGEGILCFADTYFCSYRQSNNISECNTGVHRQRLWDLEYEPEALEEAFKKYPKVKAVLVVHLYGLSADMDKIVEICKKHDVQLIEDAAESLGTTYKGRYTGTIGDYGIYSSTATRLLLLPAAVC